MTFAATHLATLSLGLVSLDALETTRTLIGGFWHLPVISLVVPVALTLHVSGALGSVLRRVSLRMPAGEVTRAVFGLMIPLGLLGHLIATRLFFSLYDLEVSYALFFLLDQPVPLLFTVAMLALIWTHACIGLYYWLRLRRWFERLSHAFVGFVLIFPTLAILGTVNAARQATANAADPQWAAGLVQQLPMAPTELRGLIEPAYQICLLVWLSAVAVAFASRWLIIALKARHKTIQIQYSTGEKVMAFPGTSLLDTSRLARIDHVSVCGGRGRCSTCRVRIETGAETLAPPAVDEHRILERIGAPTHVRLACQTFPEGNVRIHPLVQKPPPPARVTARREITLSSEQEIAILFADLRSFTRFSEKRLPFDVVYVLNQYFQYMGRAIELNGGYVDKFIGDGLMALFGIDEPAQVGCRNAIFAAQEMARRFEQLNAQLAGELAEPLRFGIGIHSGQAIVGEMGYGHASALTAIGDAVNTASRLEGMSKELACEVVVSAAAADRSRLDFATFARQEVAVRGRDAPMAVYAIPTGTDLVVRLGQSAIATEAGVQRE